MSIFGLFRIALKAFSRHRLRALLVVGHIAVTVALVIVLAGMATGLSSTMNSGINSFVGSLLIAPKQPSAQGSNAPRTTLRNTDVDALQRGWSADNIRGHVAAEEDRASQDQDLLLLRRCSQHCRAREKIEEDR